MITDAIIDGFVRCEQKAYQLLSSDECDHCVVDPFRDRICARRLDQLRRYVAGRALEDCELAALEPGAFAEASATAYVMTPSIHSATYRISFDALEINPSKRGDAKLTRTPIRVIAAERISKYDRLAFCVAALILQEHNPRIRTPYCRVLHAVKQLCHESPLNHCIGRQNRLCGNLPK